MKKMKLNVKKIDQFFNSEVSDLIKAHVHNSVISFLHGSLEPREENLLKDLRLTQEIKEGVTYDKDYSLDLRKLTAFLETTRSVIVTGTVDSAISSFLNGDLPINGIMFLSDFRVIKETK